MNLSFKFFCIITSCIETPRVLFLFYVFISHLAVYNYYIDLADMQGDLYCHQVWVLHVMHYYARFMLVTVRT